MRWSVNLTEKPESYGLKDIYDTIEKYLNKKIEKLLFYNLYIHSYENEKLKTGVIFGKPKNSKIGNRDNVENEIVNYIIDVFKEYDFKFLDSKYSTKHEFSLSESYQIIFENEKEISLEEFFKNILQLNKIKELLSNGLNFNDIDITNYVSHFTDEKNKRSGVFLVSKNSNDDVFKINSEEYYHKCSIELELTFKNEKLMFDIGYSNSKDFVNISYYSEEGKNFIRIWSYLKYDSPKEKIIEEKQLIKNIIEEIEILKYAMTEFPKGNLSLYKTVKECKNIRKLIEDLTSF